MPLLRFRVYWEEDDQIYRDIEINSGQSFLDFHKIILQAYSFDGKHAASFYESNDRWKQQGREISSEVLVNKKDAPALSMVKTPISALVAKPDQKFIYVYDPVKSWTFLVELIGITKDEDPKKNYPRVSRKEGIAPPQYGAKELSQERMMETEEQYDLDPDQMAEGFGSEGEDPESFGGSESFED